MPELFVTAFDPFGRSPVNASRELALLWARRDPRVQVAVLPVVRGLAWRVAQSALNARATPPRLWIALGEAAPAPQVVRIEKVALNYDDFRLPDNLGCRVEDTRIHTEGPDAYFTTLPAGGIVAGLVEKTPIPVQLSLSAGSFLCNHLAYQALHAGLSFPFVFVHVPAWRPENGPERLDALVETLQAVADAALI